MLAQNLTHPVIINHCSKLISLSHKQSNFEIVNILYRNLRRSILLVVFLIAHLSIIKILKFFVFDYLCVMLYIVETLSIWTMSCSNTYSIIIQILRWLLLTCQIPRQGAKRWEKLTLIFINLRWRISLHYISQPHCSSYFKHWTLQISETIINKVFTISQSMNRS